MPGMVRLFPEQGRVIKRFTNRDEFEKELYIYLKRPEFAPELLDHNHRDEIVIRYLDAPSIGRLDRPAFHAVGPLFYALHQLEDEVICHRDVNPKNYLQGRDRTWMIDFADWEYGRAEEDLIHFLLFWASIRSADDFRTIVAEVTSGYPGFLGIDPGAWREGCERMTRAFDQRRARYGKCEASPIGNPEVNRKLLAHWVS
jgi:Ser/Thr protein kinase RdoA (MazF antagonist)